MKAYSLDLREKLVGRYQAGGISQRELAKQFGVSFLRRTAARSYEAWSEAITAAMKTITATDARNWIIHCGNV